MQEANITNIALAHNGFILSLSPLPCFVQKVSKLAFSAEAEERLNFFRPLPFDLLNLNYKNNFQLTKL